MPAARELTRLLRGWLARPAALREAHARAMAWSQQQAAVDLAAVLKLPSESDPGRLDVEPAP